MGNNLFTDVYQVQKMCFGEHCGSEEKMDECRREVFECVQSGKTPKLRFLMYKMTNYCNSNCAYCSHAAFAHKQEVKSEVPYEEIVSTIQQAAELGATAMSLNGGEPLLRKDLADIISVSYKYNITPVLMTNGLLLPKWWRKLGDSGLKYIIFSVDSLDKKNYEKQRGARYEDAMAGIEAAVHMKENYEGMSIHVTSVLTRENYKLIPEMISYMSERGISVQISPYHHFDPHKEDKLSIIQPEEIYGFTEKLLNMKQEGYLIANSKGFIEHFPAFFLEKRKIPKDYECLVGYTNLFVDAYGNVRPCWASCFEPLGNLKETSLREMWCGEKMQSYREKMLKGQCEGCWYLCTGEMTMFLKNLL